MSEAINYKEPLPSTNKITQIIKEGNHLVESTQRR